MDIITIPDALLGENMDSANIFFYLRESGPDQVKVKLDYTQNMLCFMLKGMKEIIDEQERYQMNHEQIGLVSSGKMLMSERVTLKQEFASLLIFFSNEFLADFLTKHEIVLKKSAVSSSPVITFPKDDYLLNFQQSMKLLESNFSKKPFRVAKVEEILLYLLEKHPDQTIAFMSRAIHQIRNNSLIQVIQNHKFKKLNSQELAFLCNMSLSTFKRKFYDVYKTSPKKYMLGERMKKAERLLQHKKRPSEIYYELGYENLSSFSLEFKKHFGLSPRTYQLKA